MRNTNSKRGQSLIDVILQETGSFTDVVLSAMQNDLSLTEDIQINESVLTDRETDPDQIKIFKNKRPATALRKNQAVEAQRGIGWMIIEKTFKVS